MWRWLSQNRGEGWLIPETLRLADYGLGHDERARQSQPVASCLGPRFYDWQLAQRPEETWRECHVHVRNLLGHEAYERFRKERAEHSVDVESARTSLRLNDVAHHGVGDETRYTGVAERGPEILRRVAEPTASYPTDLFGADGP